VEILFQKEKLEAEHKNKMKSQGEYENLQKHVKEEEEHLEHLRSMLAELGEVEYDQQKHLQLKSELEVTEKKKEKFRELHQTINELPLVEKEIEELTQREQSILREVQKFESELIQLAFEEPVFKQKSLDLENMRQKVFDLQLAIKDFIYQERLILQERESIELQIQQNVTLENEVKSLEQERLYLEKLSLILADFKLHLIGRIRPTLARVAKQLLAEMTEGKYNDLELDENYETLIYDNGQKFGLERFSGGEKDLANLCLRLAISNMISESSGAEFSFIILDEVFGSQDIQRKENILKALASLKGRFRQIFLITHIEDIKDSVDNLITVVESEDGTSQIVMQ
jgi:exonuclease SbcC